MRTFDSSEIFPPLSRAAQTMYVIVYPDSCKEEVIELLDSVGVPGFTETEKVVGRGQRGRHFDNAIWPGADGMMYVVVGPKHGQALGSALVEYNRSLELRSRGLSGLHVFTWQCNQLL